MEVDRKHFPDDDDDDEDDDYEDDDDEDDDDGEDEEEEEEDEFKHHPYRKYEKWDGGNWKQHHLFVIIIGG